MRGILIDPTTRTITECELEQKNLFDQLYKLMDCDMVERFNLPYHQNVDARSMDDMWLDEMGWLKGNPRGFMYGGALFAGKCVILGANRDFTKSVSTKLSLEEVEDLVIWH
jgi:hypothetical protein